MELFKDMKIYRIYLNTSNETKFLLIREAESWIKSIISAYKEFS